MKHFILTVSCGYVEIVIVSDLCLYFVLYVRIVKDIGMVLSLIVLKCEIDLEKMGSYKLF